MTNTPAGIRQPRHYVILSFDGEREIGHGIVDWSDKEDRRKFARRSDKAMRAGHIVTTWKPNHNPNGGHHGQHGHAAR
ncbi:hypothetical protein IZ6_25340 [Terrihabitans soli]|uniref:Uncharacterized protein n=1 Tax=Terrihabitans soli TaxID=708113 RepID=A0A6S6QRW4_9HYPH|nr:hypothetical protein [Terrihabitans soli]BCJ91799.1 hypothetical protein IZ6_25340 [Terrihabitans soli]